MTAGDADEQGFVDRPARAVIQPLGEYEVKVSDQSGVTFYVVLVGEVTARSVRGTIRKSDVSGEAGMPPNPKAGNVAVLG